jgi:hypothetical protein
MKANNLELQEINFDDAVVLPHDAQEAVASWERTISACKGDRRVKYGDACVELLRLADKSNPIVAQKIIDRLYEMAVVSGIDADTSQAMMAGARSRRANGQNAAHGIHQHWDRLATRPQAAPIQIIATPSLDEWDAGDDADLPPPRHWLLGNQFCRRFISGLLAPGGTGKTATRMLQFLSLATGKPLSGQHVFKRCRVLIVSLEDDADELRRRKAAACIHHGIDPADLKGWLFCAAPKGFKLAEIKDGTRQAGELERMLRQAIERRRPDLVSLDPFIKLHAMEENDNGAMDFVCDLLVKLAIEYDIAVDAPHHTKKGQVVAGDADAGRGASSARDAGRLVYTLTRMTDEEAASFGVKHEDRALYVRLDSAKVNIAPPSSGATWFKLVGVRLGNGTADYPNGDAVQTVEPWQPPKTWDVPTDKLNAVLTDIEVGMPNGQRYSDAPKASTRAAWPVVQRHCPDRTEAQCRQIIKTWVKTGLLLNDKYDDPVDRKKERIGLRVDNSKRPG